MRRFVSYIFLILLVFPFLGTWVWLYSRMHAARYDARIAMSKPEMEEDLVLWKFTAEEAATRLQWEHAREFEYNGEMYDVVRFETRGDTTWYWCHHDRKETRVKKAMSSLWMAWLGGSPQQQQDQQRLIDFFKSLFPPHPAAYAGVPPRLERNDMHNYDALILEVIIPPVAPPPKFG